MVCSAAISSSQIKAARALVDWSQEDLSAASGLSIATVRKLELGFISPRHTTTSMIRTALERAGCEFLDQDGVRRRSDEIVTFKGADALTSFLDDVYETLQRTGGDLVMIDPNQYGLAAMHERELERILQNNDSSKIKCLHTEALDLVLSTPRFEHRFISRQYVDPLPFCVYGDRLALMITGSAREMKIVVMNSAPAAMASLRQFYSMWEKATPFDVGSLVVDKVTRLARA